MANKKYSLEQAVVKLRQIDVLLGEGKSISQACKEAGITDVTCTTGARSMSVRRGTCYCYGVSLYEL